MQYPQPLQMSSCTTTVPNSVRNSAPVGQTSRQPACVQCLHTLDIISQRKSLRSYSPVRPGSSVPGMPRNCGCDGVTVAAARSASGAGPTPGSVPVSGTVVAPVTAVVGAADPSVGEPANTPEPGLAGRTGCSMNATCRHEFAV